jgi:hypothetical protein
VCVCQLAQVWSRLADLLVAHTRAEEEVCFPPMYGARALAVTEAAAADHDDIREAVEQARFLEVGSARWWRLITAARTACARHFASQERDLLASLCSCLPPATGKALVHQWAAFVAQVDAARVAEDGCPGRKTS